MSLASLLSPTSSLAAITNVWFVCFYIFWSVLYPFSYNDGLNDPWTFSMAFHQRHILTVNKRSKILLSRELILIFPLTAPLRNSKGLFALVLMICQWFQSSEKGKKQALLRTTKTRSKLGGILSPPTLIEVLRWRQTERGASQTQTKVSRRRQNSMRCTAILALSVGCDSLIETPVRYRRPSNEARRNRPSEFDHCGFLHDLQLSTSTNCAPKQCYNLAFSKAGLYFLYIVTTAAPPMP